MSTINGEYKLKITANGLTQVMRKGYMDGLNAAIKGLEKNFKKIKKKYKKHIDNPYFEEDLIMSVSSRLKEKIRTRELVKKVTVLEEEVNCKLYSIRAMEGIKMEENNEQVASFLSKQFLDPETGEEVFSPDMILNDLTNEECFNLLSTFLKANGAGSGIEKILEKN